MVKKRFLSLGLSVLMLSMLVGCGSSSDEQTTTGASTRWLNTEAEDVVSEAEDIFDEDEDAEEDDEDIDEDEDGDVDEWYDIDMSDANCQKYLDNLRVLALDAEDGNAVYSPVSLNTALDVFSYLIEDGTQKDSIKSFIGDTDYLTYRSLDKSGKYTITNRIWANSNKTLNFKQNEVAPLVYPIDMSDSGKATQEKNDYVSQMTKGFIDGTPTVLDNKVTTDVMNVVYFKDSWSEGDLSMTDEKIKFNNQNGSSFETEMMKTDANYYYENDTCYVVPMRYESGMIFYGIYPKGNLEDVDLTNIFANSVYNHVDIKIPEFDGYNVFDVTEKQNDLGFNINGSIPNYYDGVDNEFSITQVAKIKVDRKGTEAAAVTEIMTKDNAIAGPIEEPLELVFDKPFYYMIGDINNDVAFIGQVLNLK